MNKTNNKVFNILSIDGGGILGLYSANFLELLEKEFFKEKKLSEYFNLVTGTSTGGIIALALAIGSDAETIKNFYLNDAEKIFPYTQRKRKGLLRNKYSNKELQRALYSFFGSRTVHDCKTSFCIPSINASTCKPIVFKTNNSGLQNRDLNYHLVDIAMATSAAPTYFPLHKFENFQGLVDGGLWQNNPSMIGLVEALSYFVGEDKEYSSIRILSVGNPNSSIKPSLDVRNCKSGLLKWKANIVTLPMKINSIGTDEILKILARSKAAYISKYLRIESNNLPSSFSSLALDSADKYSLKMLLELSEQDYNTKRNELYQFFSD